MCSLTGSVWLLPLSPQGFRFRSPICEILFYRLFRVGSAKLVVYHPISLYLSISLYLLKLTRNTLSDNVKPSKTIRFIKPTQLCFVSAPGMRKVPVLWCSRDAIRRHVSRWATESIVWITFETKGVIIKIIELVCLFITMSVEREKSIRTWLGRGSLA